MSMLRSSILSTAAMLLATTAAPAATMTFASLPDEGAQLLSYSENGIKAEDIESIEIISSPFTIKNVGVIFEPADILEAHFSTAFGCAVRLFRGGNGVYDYKSEDLKDPRFLDIARRVKCTPDDAMEEERIRYNSRPATAKVVTKDGKSFEKYVQFCRGTPRNPASDDELAAKFTNAVAPRLGDARAAQIVDRVMNFEKLEDVGELIRLTVKGGH